MLDNSVNTSCETVQENTAGRERKLPLNREELSKIKSRECSTYDVGPPYVKALLSMGFSRQEFWSGLPFPSPGDLPDAGIEAGPPALQADSLLSETPGKSP